MVVDLERVAALPEEVLLHGPDQCVLTLAVTLSQLGGERNALSRVQMPDDVWSESRKTNGRRPKRTCSRNSFRRWLVRIP